MSTIPYSKIVQGDRRRPEKDFRYPEVEIEGVEYAPTSDQVSETVFSDDERPVGFDQQINAPRDLRLDFQRRRKKGVSTFVDAFILYEPASGAVKHEFRVSKIEGDGETVS
jgi:hypothetical protein